MLVEDDSKKKRESAKAEIIEVSGSLTHASVASSSQEVWIVVTNSTSCYSSEEAETKIVGVFSSKKDAIKNAKVAFANMEGFEEVDWKDVNDYSMKIGERGGTVFEMEMGEGDTNQVKIEKNFLNKDIKAKAIRQMYQSRF